MSVCFAVDVPKVEKVSMKNLCSLVVSELPTSWHDFRLATSSELFISLEGEHCSSRVLGLWFFSVAT